MTSFQPPLKSLLAVMLGLAYCSLTVAADAGRVMTVTGSLTAKSAAGSLKVLAVKDPLVAGDTLYTGNDSYARLRFSDGGEIDLRPNTHFQVAKYSFDESKPDQDGVSLALIKGSLRARTGLISKRGNKDSYEMKAQDAIIGVRGTEYGLQSCHGDCEDVKSADGSPARDGLHSQLDHGAIVVRNQAGSIDLEPGQFSYVSDNRSPPERVAAHKIFGIDIPSRVLREWEKSSPSRGRECAAK